LEEDGPADDGVFAAAEGVLETVGVEDCLDSAWEDVGPTVEGGVLAADELTEAALETDGVEVCCGCA